MTTERPASPPDRPAEPGRGQPRGRRPRWQEAGVLLAVALALVVLVKTLLVQAFYIPSNSMEPGLVRDDRILVEKVSYWFGGSPERGDVVVFEDPAHWLGPEKSAGPTGRVGKLMERVGLYPSGRHLVKRVVGVGGDTIHCCDDAGRLEVNGAALDEQGYARDGGATCFGPMIGCDWTAGPVPDGSLFVMGDNRNHSADSSYHLCQGTTGCVPGDAFVPVDLVVGKVWVMLWPLSRFHWLHRPGTFARIPTPGGG